MKHQTDRQNTIENRLGDVFDVTSAVGRDESLRLLESGQQFDVVAIADPSGRFRRLLEQIRKTQPHAKIVLVSGFPNVFAGCRVDATIARPFISDLRQVVIGLLAGS